ncbi:NUDIX hydrolase [Agrococcus sp. SGAir0287]|uniref:NUDIX hydrolase n=1 Tax=Agrococcus sp. SGAir0287 TaxID=2070347 RepID=UPI001C30EF0A|nr:NUDIX domain-containing protein [Agrococcus sp. SGAir0287]
MTSHHDASGRSLADYPRPSVAVDTAVLTVDGDALRVLLVDAPERRGRRLPGTFLHAGETLEDAVRRSLEHKAGVTGVRPSQLHVFDALDRDTRGWVLSVAHVVVVPPQAAGHASLVPIDDAHGLDFDHDDIVTRAVAWMRGRYAEHPDPDGVLDDAFTLRELRRVHETVAGQRLQPDTFRRAMLPHLAETGEVARGGVGKPAQRFRRR